MIPALTLRQPWASLIGRGKSIETRPWRTQHRGLIAIHAGAMPPTLKLQEAKDMITRQPALMPDGFADFCDLPFGAVVAIASLAGCRSTGQRKARCGTLGDAPWVEDLQALYTAGDSNELIFGDYRPNRWGWILEDIRILAEPIACRGFQQLWTLPAAIEQAVREQSGHLLQAAELSSAPPLFVH